MATARKEVVSGWDANQEADFPDDEVTIERRRTLSGRPTFETRPTPRVVRIDEQTLAIARGAAEPEAPNGAVDPFGGLIPIFDEPQPTAHYSALPGPRFSWSVPTSLEAVPRLRVAIEDIVGLELDRRSGFVLSHIDGTRTVGEIVRLSLLQPADGLEAIEELFMIGVLDLE